MRSRLFLAPGWVQALVTGIFFGVYMATLSRLRDDVGWLPAVGIGALSGLLFGVYMGWVARREQTGWRRAAGLDLDGEELLIVHRAMTKGPMPSDPRLRLAVRHAADHDIARQDGPWTGAAVLLAFPVVIALHGVDWRWWLVLIPLCLWGTYEVWSHPRRLRARIALLSDDPR